MKASSFNKNIFKKYKQNRLCEKNNFTIGILIILFIILFNFGIYCVTGTNLISTGIKNVLSSLGIYTEEIKSIELKSEDWDSKAGGSWHIDKSAQWTGTDTAQVLFDVKTNVKPDEKNKDIILVLDISGSMQGNKIEKLKKDASELVDILLTNKENNISVILFYKEAVLLSEFTNDKETLITKINDIDVQGGTNYNAALLKTLEVLENYEQKDQTDLNILFLTDGYPSKDNPNQIATYQIIKDKFPYATVAGVQYGMGTEIINAIKEISDKQYIANLETLGNVLINATINPPLYEKFEVVDYIENDYFFVESVEDIKTEFGTIKLENENGIQKIVWTLPDNFRTGNKATMTIDLKLKEEYKNNKGLYPTNRKEIIASKLPNEESKEMNSSKTPVLKSYFNVIYDTNPPKGCNIKEITSNEHSVFENVQKRNDELTCEGFQFKGWEIVENDVKLINDDYFIMPSHDITIRATWTKPNVIKSMEGTINEKLTLYKTIESKFGKENVALYTGAGATDFKYPVYYYYSQANNNVIFANYCWQIVRTTEQGGIKMIYNGIPTNGTCNNTNEASQLGVSAFNPSYKSLSDVGYMYNKSYIRDTYDFATSSYLYSNHGATSDANYYFSKNYRIENGRYYLENPIQLGVWSDIYPSLNGEGYFTCRKETADSCSKLYYIVETRGSSMYTIDSTNAIEFEEANKKINLSTEMIENADGSYSLSGDIKTILLSDWYQEGSQYTNYYICSDHTLTTCNSMNYILEPSEHKYKHFIVNQKIKYGNDVIYENGKYKLIDTELSEIKAIWNYTRDKDTIKYNHYTCLNDTGECEEVIYITFFDVEGIGYITLSSGKKVEEALVDMISAPDINTNDSEIKKVIDNWYENNMLLYTNYLEDTVWCNDRSIGDFRVFDPNSSDINRAFEFRQNSSSGRNLMCPNILDRFTVNNENGNGALKYPIGLLTAGEVRLAYMKSGSHDENAYIMTDSPFWLMTPSQYSGYSSRNFVFGTIEYTFNAHPDELYGVRPAISLYHETEYSSGDGSNNKPYIVD